MSDSQKKILISGGSRGIGKAIAFLLRNEGHEIYAPSSKELDVTSLDSINQYCDENNLNDGLYSLICNAGIHAEKAFLKQSYEEWQKIMDVNVNGTFHLCQKLIPGLVNSNHANKRIIIISSISGLRGEAYASAYATSKAALIGLTKSLALEFAKDSITVNAICPGWVKTDMSQAQLNSPEKEAANIGATLQNRWIEAEEIAHMTKYLLSQEAYGITGQALEISAGL